MEKINILVTGIGGGGNGEQILKAFRMAKGLINLLTIIGMDMVRYASGRGFVDVFYESPPASDPSYESFIFSLIEKHNVKFVFHGSEAEMKFLSEKRDKLAEMGVFHPLNSKELTSLCMNKFTTFEKLKSLGIDVPKYLKINELKDLYKIDFFPVVLKPNTASGNSSYVNIAIDKEEALLLGKYLLKRDVDIVAQEYIGTHDEEYTIGVSSDQNGNVLGSIAVKRFICNVISVKTRIKEKDKTYVISSGFSQGKVCYIPELQKKAEHIAKLLDSRGPLNIQCRYVGGKLMLLEINPRISGTTSLRAMAGYNEPELMIRHYILGEEWKCNYREMVIMRGLSEVEITE